MIRSIRKDCGMFFDVHLMIQEPVRYIREFVEAGADSITVHVESCSDIQKTIDEMKQYRIKVALSVNPATGVDAVLPYLDQIDMVLVMGVEPGFGGQKLIPQTLEKVKELDRLRKEKGLSYQIELDGGVNRENLAKIIEHGTDIAVAGTAVFRGNIRENVRDLQEVIAGASREYCTWQNYGDLCGPGRISVSSGQQGRKNGSEKNLSDSDYGWWQSL